jgi:DNA-binding transcriptional ArsR family regulator
MSEPLNLVKIGQICQALTERRLKLLVLLLSAGRPMTVSEVATYGGVSDALASHHLLALKRQDIVRVEQVGKFAVYEPNRAQIEWLTDQLEGLLSSAPVALDLSDDEEEDSDEDQ